MFQLRAKFLENDGAKSVLGAWAAAYRETAVLFGAEDGGGKSVLRARPAG